MGGGSVCAAEAGMMAADSNSLGSRESEGARFQPCQEQASRIVILKECDRAHKREEARLKDLFCGRVASTFFKAGPSVALAVQAPLALPQDDISRSSGTPEGVPLHKKEINRCA